MSRKHLQEAWEAMTVLKTFRLSQVNAALQHTNMDSLKAFAKRLEGKRIVRRTKDYDEDFFTVIKPKAKPFDKTKSRAVQANSGRQKMWQSMRILRDFEVAQVAATAEVTVNSAQSYISLLKKAGYLMVAKQAPRTGTAIARAGEDTIYRLLRDTGPTRPIPRANGVFDANQRRLQPFGTQVKQSSPVMEKVVAGEVHEQQ